MKEEDLDEESFKNHVITFVPIEEQSHENKNDLPLWIQIVGLYMYLWASIKGTYKGNQ